MQVHLKECMFPQDTFRKTSALLMLSGLQKEELVKRIGVQYTSKIYN